MTLPLNPDDSYTLTQADLASLQDGLLRLLVEFDHVCQKLGIPYQLGAGTLLGAVRHQGFVPWDDDADVCLLRSDYERLLALGSSELSPGFFLQHAGSEPSHPWLFAKLRLDGTEFVCPETRARNIHQGVYLDIFPFDDVRPHSVKGKVHLEITRWVRIARAIYQTGQQRKLATRRAYPVRLMVNLAYRALSMVSEQHIDRVTNSIVMFFSRRSEQSKPETRYVTCLVSGSLDNKQGRLRRIRRYKDFISTTLTLGTSTPEQAGTTTRSNFCGHSFPIPNNFDEVLTNLYGGYQQLPPPDKRKPTHKTVRFRMDMK